MVETATSADRTDPEVPSVLVVDDDPDVSRIVSQILEDSGYHVHVASDLTQAERACCALHPDLVLCDLVLPDGLGSDLLRRLTDRRNRRHSPASILMSSHPDALRHAKNAHADAYIPKPFDLDELCSTVDRVLAENDSH